MMIIRIKGIQTIRKPGGREYHYHRTTKTRIKSPPNTPEFAAEVAAIEAKAAAEKPRPEEKKIEGTWGWLVTYWKATPEWAQLAPRTKSDYQKVLNYLSKLDAAPLTAMTPAEVMHIRNKAFNKHKRRFANYVLAVISRAWTVGQAIGMTPHGNPVSSPQKLRRPKNARVVNRPWTPDEVEAFMGAASRPLTIAAALALMAGWREGDVCSLPASAYNGREIQGRQNKTGELVWMPAQSALRAILDEELERLPRLKDAPLVINQRGRRYTESGLRASFFKVIRDLLKKGKVNPGLTFHGLRVTLATNIAEAGGDTRAIAAALGQTTEAMARHYARFAEKKRDARRAIALLERPENEDL